MRLLVLGGTVFLGARSCADALGRGHEVTVFNRGHHPTPAGVTQLRGDRAASDLGALATGEWDSVIDTSGYVPRLVGASATLLAPRIGHYCFVSSVSVYAPGPAPDESAPVATLSDPTVEDIGGGNYGALKALCETAADAATDGRSLAVRPGLIVGPHDPTGRFTYWPHRFARGGDVLVFDRPERPTQFVDVRDLAAWIVGACEARITGPVNVTASWTMGALVDACLAEAPPGTRPVWVPRGPARRARGGRVDGAAAVDRAGLARGGVPVVDRLRQGDRHRPDAAAARRHRPRHAGRRRAGRRRRARARTASASCCLAN